MVGCSTAIAQSSRAYLLTDVADWRRLAASAHNRLVALISSADQQRLRDAFAEMSRPVRMLFFTQALGCETCLQTREIIDELPPLSARISVEEVNLVLEAAKAAQYGIDR